MRDDGEREDGRQQANVDALRGVSANGHERARPSRAYLRVGPGHPGCPRADQWMLFTLIRPGARRDLRLRRLAPALDASLIRTAAGGIPAAGLVLVAGRAAATRGVDAGTEGHPARRATLLIRFASRRTRLSGGAFDPEDAEQGSEKHAPEHFQRSTP